MLRQIPQFLLDEFLLSSNISHRSIICTQPRRISAIAVAERIAKERDEEVGNIVGYNVRTLYRPSLNFWINHQSFIFFCQLGAKNVNLETVSYRSTFPTSWNENQFVFLFDVSFKLIVGLKWWINPKHAGLDGAFNVDMMWHQIDWMVEL